MKAFFDYIKAFAFKNFFAFCLTGGLLYILLVSPQLRDLTIVLLTLVVKHYFDSNTGSMAKDITISKALDQAQQLPAAGASNPPMVGNADTVNVGKQ